uniref:CSD domain-containing protein n=1 Tax=Oxyrrhis marina TaxID=2969 RepID=A0A7S3XIE3_OXYMA
MWNELKGFGFITPEDESGDLFVHRTSLVGCAALAEGDKVTFRQVFDPHKQKYRADQVSGGTGVPIAPQALMHHRPVPLGGKGMLRPPQPNFLSGGTYGMGSIFGGSVEPITAGGAASSEGVKVAKAEPY